MAFETNQYTLPARLLLAILIIPHQGSLELMLTLDSKRKSFSSFHGRADLANSTRNSPSVALEKGNPFLLLFTFS